jgi:hypothetical protein
MPVLRSSTYFENSIHEEILAIKQLLLNPDSIVDEIEGGNLNTSQILHAIVLIDPWSERLETWIQNNKEHILSILPRYNGIIQFYHADIIVRTLVRLYALGDFIVSDSVMYAQIIYNMKDCELLFPLIGRHHPDIVKSFKDGYGYFENWTDASKLWDVIQRGYKLTLTVDMFYHVLGVNKGDEFRVIDILSTKNVLIRLDVNGRHIKFFPTPVTIYILEKMPGRAIGTRSLYVMGDRALINYLLCQRIPMTDYSIINPIVKEIMQERLGLLSLLMPKDIVNMVQQYVLPKHLL